MGDHLELRPSHEGDLTIIEKLTQDPEVTGEFAWFGWHDQLRWRRGWAENRLLGDAGGLLMVVRGDRPLGFVNWRRHQATVTGFYWEIGIAMLPEARGHGDGTQAHRLLARYLFAHTTAHRIEASTESPAPSAGATANGATESPTASSAPSPPPPAAPTAHPGLYRLPMDRLPI